MTLNEIIKSSRCAEGYLTDWPVYRHEEFVHGVLSMLVLDRFERGLITSEQYQSACKAIPTAIEEAAERCRQRRLAFLSQFRAERTA